MSPLAPLNQDSALSAQKPPNCKTKQKRRLLKHKLASTVKIESDENCEPVLENTTIDTTTTHLRRSSRLVRSESPVSQTVTADAPTTRTIRSRMSAPSPIQVTKPSSWKRAKLNGEKTAGSASNNTTREPTIPVIEDESATNGVDEYTLPQKRRSLNHELETVKIEPDENSEPVLENTTIDTTTTHLRRSSRLFLSESPVSQTVTVRLTLARSRMSAPSPIQVTETVQVHRNALLPARNLNVPKPSSSKRPKLQVNGGKPAGSVRSASNNITQESTIAAIEDESTTNGIDEYTLPQDGRFTRVCMSTKDRLQLERASGVIYMHPSALTYNKKSQGAVAKKDFAVDYFQTNEVEEGESEDGKYAINSIVYMGSDSVLINWYNYLFPSWEMLSTLKKGSAYREYMKRSQLVNTVLNFLCKQNDLDYMRTNYPNMMLLRTTHFSELVKHPSIVYISSLRKREKQLSELFQSMNHPEKDLIFEDWTSFETSYIPNYEHIFDFSYSVETKKLHDNLLSKECKCKCTNRCCTLSTSCCNELTTTGISYKAPNKVLAYRVYRDGNNKPIPVVTLDDDSMKEHAELFVDLYECGDACTCTKECCQRVVQFGRKFPLIVWRDLKKGWTLRTPISIKSGQFVCEYLGEVMLAEEANDRSDVYQMSMDISTTTRDHTVVVDAGLKGNESRFISHSCSPNLFTYRVHFDVSGKTKRHIGLYAIRDIEAGEELTFDYFAATDDNIVFSCMCGAENCKWKKTKGK